MQIPAYPIRRENAEKNVRPGGGNARTQRDQGFCDLCRSTSPLLHIPIRQATGVESGRGGATLGNSSAAVEVIASVWPKPPNTFVHVQLA
jgi:hypothetical protein